MMLETCVAESIIIVLSLAIHLPTKLEDSEKITNFTAHELRRNTTIKSQQNTNSNKRNKLNRKHNFITQNINSMIHKS